MLYIQKTAVKRRIFFHTLQCFYLFEVCTNLIGLKITIPTQRETENKIKQYKPKNSKS